MFVEKSKSHKDRDVIVIEEEDAALETFHKLFMDFAAKNPDAIIVSNFEVYFSVRFSFSKNKSEAVKQMHAIRQEMQKYLKEKKEKEKKFSN